MEITNKETWAGQKTCVIEEHLQRLNELILYS